MIVIDNEKEMNEYFNAETNTYKFSKSVLLNFTFVDSSKSINCLDLFAPHLLMVDKIQALDIHARDITANSIYASNIFSEKIEAGKIKYEKICCATQQLNCDNINGEYISSIALELSMDVVPKYINR